MGMRLSRYAAAEQVQWQPEPRVSLRYKVKDNLSLKAQYSVNYQAVLALYNNYVGDLIGDSWLLSDANMMPFYARQGSVGIFGQTRSEWEWSIEAFYKRYGNLTEFTPDFSVYNYANDIQNKLLRNGSGESSGAEFYTQRTADRWQLSGSYTLAWNFRTFPDFNAGRAFPFLYDRRHTAVVSASYAITKKYKVSATFNAASGIPATFPVTVVDVNPFLGGRYAGFGERDVLIYDEYNNVRMRPVHRLDLMISRSWGKNLRNSLVLSIYNAYGSQNPVAMSYNYIDPQSHTYIYQGGRSATYQRSFSLILPSLLYKFSF
jgi:hypothetical protein